MPTYPSAPSGETIYTRHSRGEPNWVLVSQSEFDGLASSQIVRAMDAPDRGWEETEAQSRLADRLDATPDADNIVTNPPAESDAKGVTIDAHRYVVDPLVEKHRYTGLYTGGPVRHVEEQGRKRIVQALTRTFCAGHGYYVDEAGRYHAVWKDGAGGWVARNPDADEQVHYEASDPTHLPLPALTEDPAEAKPYEEDPADRVFLVREFATAADCLKEHRPALNSAFTPYMAFRDDIPGTYRREVVWREFTHESANALEALGTDRNALRAVVAYHFGNRVAGSVVDAHVRLDPATNTLVFVAALVWKDPYEPETVGDLLDLPHIDGPCSRETLRENGYGNLANGEGYKYTHVYRWVNLKDCEKVRNLCEFLKDSDIVLRLLGTDALAGSDSDEGADSDEGGAPHGDPEDGWKPGVPTIVPSSLALDKTGRYYFTVDRTTGEPCSAASENAVRHPWYRIILQRLQPDQDGRLEFQLVLVRPEWHGYDSGANAEDSDGDPTDDPGGRILTAVQNPQGWGIAENRVVVSVPRDDAVKTMYGIGPSVETYRVITAKHQTEGSEGHSDIPFTEETLYDYTSPEHTPANVQNPFGIEFNATFQSYNPYPRPSFQITYEKVAPSKVPDLIAHIKATLGGAPAISLTYHPGGYYTVSARGTGRKPRHIEEWITEADWFHHKTVEHWLGVTLTTNNGERGFWADDNESDSDSDADDWHSIASIRGDLDANWMGSLATMGETIDYTTGYGRAAHTPLDPQPSHGDEHVAAGGWTQVGNDPDYEGGNGEGSDSDEGDEPDKARSHAITHVRPSMNEDGTYNLTITRTYPHQRVWVWREKQAKRKGDWRYVYHASYANWPSRHAIHHDLVTNFVEWINDNYGEHVNLDSDDWMWHCSPTVNEFGLVNAGGVTIAPVIWNSKPSRKHPDKTKEGLSVVYDYRWRTQKPPLDGPARTDPAAAERAPAFSAFLGYYFCVERRPHYNGFYKDYTKASLVCQQIGGDIDKIDEVSGGYSFSHKGAWEHGWWYNGDMPRAANNWGAIDDGTRLNNIAKLFKDGGLNNEEAEALAANCSVDMTQADWEYWFGEKTPDPPSGGGSDGD